MEIRQLRSFVQIVDLGSFTRAAQRLDVAQPALSQQMAALEAELDVQLLLRSPRGARATEAGKALYRQARLILRQAQDAGSIARAAGRAVAGSVSLGLPTSTCAMIALGVALQSIWAIVQATKYMIKSHEELGNLASARICLDQAKARIDELQRQAGELINWLPPGGKLHSGLATCIQGLLPSANDLEPDKYGITFEFIHPS